MLPAGLSRSTKKISIAPKSLTADNSRNYTHKRAQDDHVTIAESLIAQHIFYMTEGSTNSDQDREYSILWDIFTNVNAQLQFAEAKNAALTTLSCGAVLALGSILAGTDVVTGDVRMWLFVTALGLAGAAATSFTSFLPQLGPMPRKVDHVSEGNFFYFKNLAKADEEKFVNEIFGVLNQRIPNKIHKDIAHQIIVNSAIAERKFRRFRDAAVIAFIVSIIPAFILCIIWIGNGGFFK